MEREKHLLPVRSADRDGFDKLRELTRRLDSPIARTFVTVYHTAAFKLCSADRTAPAQWRQ